MTTHSPSSRESFALGDSTTGSRRTASCPPLPALREALLLEEWSNVDRSHVEGCEFCRRNLSQVSAHLWHPHISSICAETREVLLQQDREEMEFHLTEDACSSCREMEQLWRDSPELQSSARSAAWVEFARKALELRPHSEALRQRLTAIVQEGERVEDASPVVERRPSLVEHVERLLKDLARGDEMARDSLVALAWSRIVNLGLKMRESMAYEINDELVAAVGERLRRALTVAPRSAREFFQVAAQQIRQELLTAVQGRPNLASADTLDAVADLTALEHRAPPNRWRYLFQQLDSGELSAEEQETVELLWLHGLSAEEAAEVVGVEPRVLRRRWRRVALRVHDLFGEDEG